MTLPLPAAAGLAGVEARIEQIRARIGELTNAQPGGAVTFTLPGRASDAAPTPQQAGTTIDAGTQHTAAAGTGPAPSWASRLPEAAQPWIGSIERAAQQAGLDPTLLAAVVRHESNFDPSTVSHAGAIGLGQLMPGTAEWLGVDPHDPEENLDGAARYLREQLDRFGTPDLALAAYNAGPNRVVQAGGIPRITETELYVERVLSTWEQLR